MTRRFLIGIAVVAALLLGWLAWDGWLYLRHGYSLDVSTAGQPGKIFHVDFPAWRTGLHILLWAAAMVAILAFVTGRRWASTAAWLTFAATLIVGLYDVVQYGTIGAPTSIWTVLIVLAFALMTRLSPPQRTEAA